VVKHRFNIKNYWKVIVYYDMDYNFFNCLADDLRDAGITGKGLSMIYNNLCYKKAKAVTYSNLEFHKSVVVFNKHVSVLDYINSLVHEAEHVKQAMLSTYKVEDKGEAPAYTIGYIVMQMWKVFKKLI
jgi:hypothetical protein